MSRDLPEPPARIAVVEDDSAVRRLFESILRSAGHLPSAFASGNEFLGRGAGPPFDVVITDLQMEGASGIDVLKACRTDPDPPEVLLVTGYASVRNAVEAMRLGAFDYLAKPADPKDLLHRVTQALETRRLKRAVDALAGEVRRSHSLAPPVAESPRMREFLSRALRAAETSSTVLILGETGTGKDVIARHIQAMGSRSARTYLTVNCAALPDNLLESELFGHARGAFSGAHAMKRGLFEEASGGTLFLDEVGSMSAAAQAKLLRVLEEGAVRRVGENQPVPVDVRILAATNRNLPEAVAAGEFREDLYYRLSVVTLAVPPLRDRREDIMPLARAFLAESVRRLGKLRVFSPEVPAFLEAYRFPGNIRELRYAIEQAAILSEDGVIHPSDFTLSGAASGMRAAQPSRQQTKDISAEMIRRALEESGGSRIRAAKALGVSRATFYRLLERSARVGAVGDEEASASDV